MTKSKGNHKKRFNKQQTVRFALVPGPQKDGKSTTVFQPLQTHKTRLSIRQRQDIIKQLTDDAFDQIQINGRDVNSNQIPAFILQQIRGRKDLVFNQKNAMREQQMLQDEEEILEQEEYEDEQGNMQLEGDEEFQGQSNEIPEEQEDWESDQGDIDVVDLDQQTKDQPTGQFRLKDTDFPAMQEMVEVQFQGSKYILTKKQQELLNCVLPENYNQIIIPGIKFKRYNQDGLDMQYQEKYQEFLSDGAKNVIDTFQYIPTKPVDRLDNDLRPEQIKGQLKQIHQALDFQGQQQAYQELEDDFFVKLMSGNAQQQGNKPKESKKKVKKNKRKLNDNESGKQFQSDGVKFEAKIKNVIMEEPQITDEMLEKALEQFQNQHGVEQEQKLKSNDQSMKELMSIHDLQKMQEYLGKDGQLDWRKLSRPAKKQYMRQKKIRESYDIARDREIEQKMKDKKNVNPEDLHLKQWVSKIPIQQDHVQLALLEREEQGKGLDDQSSQYETTSEQDDITSYRLKTSVIASNLSIIEQPSTRKRRDKKGEEEADWKDQSMQNSVLKKEKPKFVPEKRDKNESKEERKARKEKVKQMKKATKEHKRQFNKEFGEQQRKFNKGQNKSAFHKVSCIRIN